MTPEGAVKKMIKDELAKYGVRVYQHWPVLNGMGSPELDCNLIVNGYAVSIEAKAPGETMTKRQQDTTKNKRAAGGIVFEVDSPHDLNYACLAIEALLEFSREEAIKYESKNMEDKQWLAQNKQKRKRSSLSVKS